MSSGISNLFVSATTNYLFTLANKYGGDIEVAKKDLALEFSNIVNFTQEQSNALTDILKEKTNLLEDIKAVSDILKVLDANNGSRQLEISIATIDTFIKTVEFMIKESIEHDS